MLPWVDAWQRRHGRCLFSAAPAPTRLGLLRSIPASQERRWLGPTNEDAEAEVDVEANVKIASNCPVALRQLPLAATGSREEPELGLKLTFAKRGVLGRCLEYPGSAQCSVPSPSGCRKRARLPLPWRGKRAFVS